jgi:hypothetical protein
LLPLKFLADWAALQEEFGVAYEALDLIQRYAPAMLVDGCRWIRRLESRIAAQKAEYCLRRGDPSGARAALTRRAQHREPPSWKELSSAGTDWRERPGFEDEVRLGALALGFSPLGANRMRGDLLEWELDGEPTETCSDILNCGFDEKTRRLALLAALEASRGGSGSYTEWAGNVCLRLGHVRETSVVSALEKFYRESEPAVRIVVMQAIRGLHDPRVMSLIVQGARDEDPAVRAEAIPRLQLGRNRRMGRRLAHLFWSSDDHEIRQAIVSVLCATRSIPYVRPPEVAHPVTWA